MPNCSGAGTPSFAWGVNYDGQIKDSEMREIERLAENAGALFARYEKIISVIVARNMEKGERVR